MHLQCVHQFLYLYLHKCKQKLKFLTEKLKINITFMLMPSVIGLDFNIYRLKQHSLTQALKPDQWYTGNQLGLYL